MSSSVSTAVTSVTSTSSSSNNQTGPNSNTNTSSNQTYTRSSYSYASNSSNLNNNNNQQKSYTNNNNSNNSKQRYLNNKQLNSHKNYAQAALGGPSSTQNASYASTLSNSGNKQKSNISNQIANLNSSNLAKMDNKLKQDRQHTEGIYRNTKFMNASNTILGCPVILRVKSNDTFHGIFVTFSPEFDVLLECCHKIDPKNEVVIFGRSLPKKSDVHARFFERENIVEMTAFEVDKDFAIKSAENNFIDAAIAQKVSTLNQQQQQQKANNSQNSSEEMSSDCKELEPFTFGDDDNDNTDMCIGDLNENALGQQMNGLELESGCLTTLTTTLTLDTNSSSCGWNAEDMLMTNQTKYGYKSTYNSDLTEYTLAVEKEDTDEYRKREEEAEKIALEIESSSTYRKNIDKELTDNEEEEEAFSAVVRTNNSSGEINNNTTNSNNNNVNNKEYYNNKHGDKYSHSNNSSTNNRRPFNKQQSQQQLSQQQSQQQRPSSTNMNSSSLGYSNNKRYPQQQQQQQQQPQQNQSQHKSNIERQSSLGNQSLNQSNSSSSSFSRRNNSDKDSNSSFSSGQNKRFANKYNQQSSNSNPNSNPNPASQPQPTSSSSNANQPRPVTTQQQQHSSVLLSSIVANSNSNSNTTVVPQTEAAPQTQQFYSSITSSQSYSAKVLQNSAQKQTETKPKQQQQHQQQHTSSNSPSNQTSTSILSSSINESSSTNTPQSTKTASSQFQPGSTSTSTNGTPTTTTVLPAAPNQVIAPPFVPSVPLADYSVNFTNAPLPVPIIAATTGVNQAHYYPHYQALNQYHPTALVALTIQPNALPLAVQAPLSIGSQQVSSKLENEENTLPATSSAEQQQEDDSQLSKEALARSKLNPYAMEFNPSAFGPVLSQTPILESSPSPQPLQQMAPTALVVAAPNSGIVAPAVAIPYQGPYDYQQHQMHPQAAPMLFQPASQQIIHPHYQAGVAPHSQQQTTSILINNPNGPIPLPPHQFYIMNQPPPPPPAVVSNAPVVNINQQQSTPGQNSGQNMNNNNNNKIKKATVSINEGASITISNNNANQRAAAPVAANNSGQVLSQSNNAAPYHQSTQMYSYASGQQTTVLAAGSQPFIYAPQPGQHQAPALSQSQFYPQNPYQGQQQPAQQQQHPAGNIRMIAPNNQPYLNYAQAIDQQQPNQQQYFYQYNQMIQHPHIQHPHIQHHAQFNQAQQYALSPQQSQTNIQQQQVVQQQQPPPSSTPSNIIHNQSAPHTPSPMPSSNQPPLLSHNNNFNNQNQTQHLQQFQLNYPPPGPYNYMHPSFIQQAGSNQPQIAQNHQGAPQPIQIQHQPYHGYPLPPYAQQQQQQAPQPGQQQQFMFVPNQQANQYAAQGAFGSSQNQNQHQQQSHIQYQPNNRMFYMSSNSQTNVQQHQQQSSNSNSNSTSSLNNQSSNNTASSNH